MNYDEYGEVINGPETYAIITNLLIVNQAVLIGWTDERNSHLDILFQHGNIVGNNQYRGGIKKTDLFVSILQYGAFGFKIEDKHYMPYVSDKLNLNYNVTAEKVTELLNGICKRIDKYKALYTANLIKDYRDFQLTVDENKNGSDGLIYIIKNNDVAIRISSDSFLEFSRDMARVYRKTSINWFIKSKIPVIIVVIVIILFILKKINIL